MPLVILEGPDGSGKTTLADKLLKGTGQATILIRRSGPPDDRETLDRQISWLKSQVSDLNLLIDRHPLISERIYRRILRDADWLGWTLDKTASAFANSRVLIIYCRPPCETLLKSSRSEEQLEGVHEKLLRLIDAYDALMYGLADRGVRVRRYDFTDRNFIVEQVRDFFSGDDFDGQISTDIRASARPDDSISRDLQRERPSSGSEHSGGVVEPGGEPHAPLRDPLVQR